MGGDDFVAVVDPEVAEQVAQTIARKFDENRTEFYEAEDLERGFVQMEDRKGVLQDIPLVGVSIGIAQHAAASIRPLRRGRGRRHRDEAVRQAGAGFELRDRPPHPVTAPG